MIKISWRLRILSAVLRGFLRNPAEAWRRLPSVNIEMGSVYRFKLHIYGRDFMRDVEEEASKLGIQLFLFWGTLLGYVREGDFIPHDYDIDMAMFLEDYPKKDALVRAMRARGYRVRHDLPYGVSFETKDGLLHLDIDVLQPFKDKMITSISEPGKKPVVHEFPGTEAFLPLQEGLFPRNIRVRVPRDADKVLTRIYGDWRKPVKDFHYAKDPLNRVP